jgi:hypothetical protein
MLERAVAVCSGWLRQSRRLHSWGAAVAALLLALALIGAAGQPPSGTARESGHQVSGAGKTIIEGGTGGTAPVPVTTVVAFHANAHGGAFECLALAPPAATGPESGEFEVNAMYVTGKVTSLQVTDHTAVLHGTANVTGLGAGRDVPFTAHVTAGGPGSTITLDVSGLTFHEILLEGKVDVS